MVGHPSRDAFERRRHVRRLERAMAEGRPWGAARFRAEVAAHPVLGPLAGAVLFRGEALFRLVDGQPRGLDGVPVALGDTVRVAHPATLDEGTLRRWGDLFAERRLRSPFDQLSRPTRLPEEGAALEVPPIGALDGVAVTSVLEPRGWRRGEPDSRVRVAHLLRAFGAGDPVAVLRLDPGLGLSGGGAQRLVEVCFEPEAPGGVSAGASRIPLSKVPRRLRSEVLYDLSLLPCPTGC